MQTKKIVSVFSVVSLAALLFVSTSSNLWAGDVKDLEKRLSDLETIQQQAVQQQEKGAVKSFLADRIHLGGFFTGSFQSQFGKSTARRTTFDEAHLDLQIMADITDRFSINNEIELRGDHPLNDENAAWRDWGNARTNLDLHMAYGHYHFSDAFAVEFGRLKVPFGIINVEHFEPTFLTHAKPQAFRTTSATNFSLFEIHANGVGILGHFDLGDHKVGYSGYVASMRSDTRAVGGGGRLFWQLPNDWLVLGVSNQTAQRGSQTYSTWGTDTKLKWHDFTFQAEYLRGVINNALDQNSFYLQPSYGFFDGRFVLLARVDYLDDPLGTRTVDHDRVAATAAIADPIEKYEYTGGINILPKPFLRVRVETTVHDYRGTRALLGGLNRDYYSVQTSGTLSW